MSRKILCFFLMLEENDQFCINSVPEADLATAVPEPIAIPISAFFNAGASLTPSPVIAVTSPFF